MRRGGHNLEASSPRFSLSSFLPLVDGETTADRIRQSMEVPCRVDKSICNSRRTFFRPKS